MAGATDQPSHPSITAGTGARRLRVFVGLAAVAAVAGAGYVWRLHRTIEPPMVTLVNADPNLAQVIEQARTAVKNSPSSAKAWGHLGSVFQAHAFMTEAQVCLAQAMRLDPEDGRWAYLHALYVCQTDPEQGIPALGRAAQLCDGIAAPRLKLGEALLEAGRVEEAEMSFRAVLAYDPNNPRAELGLGRAAYARGDWQESVAHLRRSVARAPGVRATHAVLAEVYQRLGDAKAAQVELGRVAETSDNALWPDPYQEAVGRLKTGIEARLEHAQMLLQQGRAAEAIPLVEELVRSRPDADAVHIAYGRLLLKIAPVRAEAEFRQALALRPTSLSAQTELAQALELQGKYREAADCYRQAVDLKPQDGTVHHRLGLCLQRLGDKEGAIGELRIAVKCKPDLTVAHSNLAELLVENGGFDEAAQHLQDALRLAPADDTARRLLTQIREQATRAPKR